MFRDYRDQVNFFYVYKRLAHPETNNFLEPANLQERLMHLVEAKRLTGSEIPWLCDTMDNAATIAFGETYNGEFVIDPQGVLVRQRFWSNPTTLRRDLVDLVGPVQDPTQIADLPVRFRPEPRGIASGVVPRIKLPRGLTPVKVKYIPHPNHPLFVKIRAEVTSKPLDDGTHQIYLGFYVDPIHKIHWNNAAGPIELQLQAPSGLQLSRTRLEGPEVEEPEDCDPRMFLLEVDRSEFDRPIKVTLRYVVCDDAATFCFPVTQEFEVLLQPSHDKSSRPGIFLDGLFADVAKRFDKNGDAKITPEELGAGNVTMYMTHLDYNLDRVIDAEEIRRFNEMYGNGRGVGK
ncbi:MAG: hypothetical protein AB8B50_09110 [Pirellulaceae bacterium]